RSSRHPPPRRLGPYQRPLLSGPSTLTSFRVAICVCCSMRGEAMKTLLKTLRIDSYNPSGVGFNFAPVPETTTVATGVMVGSPNFYGVASGSLHSTLINEGNIVSGVNAGVAFYGAYGSVTNGVGALISGVQGAFLDGGNRQTFTNDGMVIGSKIGGVF